MEKRKQLLINNWYVLSLFLYTSIRIIASTYVEKIFFIDRTIIFNLVNYFCILSLVFIFVIQNKMTIQKFIAISVMTFIIGLISFKFFDRSLIISYLFIIAYPKDISKYNLAKVIFICFLIINASILIMGMTGIVTDFVLWQHEAYRHSYGFVSPNALANSLSIMILLYYYYRNKKITKLENYIFILLIILVYYFTRSRMAIFVALLAIVLYIICNTNKEKNKSILRNLIYFCASYLMPILTILSIGITIYFSNNLNSVFFDSVNNMFTGRLNWMIMYYQDYGIHLIGEPIVTVSLQEALNLGIRWKNIDNAYMLYAIKYGTLFLVGFNLLYIKLGKYLRKNNYIFDAIFVVCLTIMGMTENFLIIIGYNFTLIFLAEFVSGYLPKKEIKNEK